MITQQYCTTMARYNQWMNDKMLDLCSSLSDVERKVNRRAYFRSIHGTLNHILAVDIMLLFHFTRGTPRFPPNGDIYQYFSELRRRRTEVDQEIQEWSQTLSLDWLETPAKYTHHGDGFSRSVCNGFWVVQMFNHQTHHRGQITTLLTQIGRDIGSTDLHMSVPRTNERFFESNALLETV